MTNVEALLYGLVQGVTEYLPISSSAHLILLPKFLGNEDPGLAFDVFLHLGTLFATLIYFWRDWMALLSPGHIKENLTGSHGVNLRNLVIATIPALICGAAFHKIIEEGLRGEGVIVVTQVVGAVMLYGADRFARSDRVLPSVTGKTALTVGLFQCLALFPGMSRSGSTMAGSRMLGFDRASAARLSFLMSAPITGAAVVFELRKYDELVNGPVGWLPLLIAGVSSFIFGWISIDLLLKVLKRVSFLGFAVYRLALAAVVYFVFKPF